MRIKNWLKQDLAEIKRIAAFIKGVKHNGVLVKIKNSRHAYAGRAYLGGRGLVVVRINPSLYPVANWYSTKYKRLAGDAITLENWQEGLLFTLAHELRHIYQHNHSKPLSEVDAERFAIKQLKRWREAERAEQERGEAVARNFVRAGNRIAFGGKPRG